MRNVLAKESPNDYRIRKIMRWYSEKYHTPLHVVDTLPRHDVLVAYFESTYESLRDDPAKESVLNEEIQELINPKDQAVDDAARAEEYLFQKKIEETEKNKKSEPPKPKPVISMPDLDGGEVSMTFADINKLDELEGKTESLVGLK